MLCYLSVARDHTSGCDMLGVLEFDVIFTVLAFRPMWQNIPCIMLWFLVYFFIQVGMSHQKIVVVNAEFCFEYVTMAV